METPLNRIESEYVLNLFVKECPAIKIMCGNGSFDLAKTEYKIEDNFIYFKHRKIKKGDTVKVFFKHKKRPLYFTSVIGEKDEFLTVNLLQKFYKDDITDAEKFPFVRITNSKGFTLKINNFENYYDLVIRMDKDFSCFKQNIKFADKPCFLPDNIYYFFYMIIKRKKMPKFKTSVLFIDSDYLLIFAPKEKTDNFLNSGFLETQISFKHRKLNFFSKTYLFYPLDKENNKLPHGILLFSLKDVQEEDKRFLYEKAYKKKYREPLKTSDF